MAIATEPEYGARVQFFEEGEFSTEYVVRIRVYKQGQLKEEQFAVPRGDLDVQGGLVRLVFANKKDRNATIGVNIAGCGGQEWFDIPVEDLVEI